MYNTVAIAEDRATLGSDPSAVMVVYSIGRYQKGYRPSFVKAWGELKKMLVPLMR